eukprot:3268468-Pleurochrysis_carterae.AAC.1
MFLTTSNERFLHYHCLERERERVRADVRMQTVAVRQRGHSSCARVCDASTDRTSTRTQRACASARIGKAKADAQRKSTLSGFNGDAPVLRLLCYGCCAAVAVLRAARISTSGARACSVQQRACGRPVCSACSAAFLACLLLPCHFFTKLRLSEQDEKLVLEDAYEMIWAGSNLNLYCA